jgi:hypothetical protein
MILGSGVSESTALAQIVQRQRHADRGDVVVQAPQDSLVAVRVEIVTAEPRKVVSAQHARLVNAPREQDAEQDSQPPAAERRATTAAPQEHAWASALLHASLLDAPPSQASDFGTSEGQRALAAYGLQHAIASHADAARSDDRPRLSRRA